MFALSGLTATNAGAQVRFDDLSPAVGNAQVRPAAQPRRFGFRGFGHYELVSMTAKDTFDAVLGSPSLQGFGGGGELLGIWKGLFVRGAVSQMKGDGSRVFVFGSDVIPINVPMTVTLRTIELGGGWRLPLRRMPRLAVYGGGGALLLSYDETADFSQAAENVKESFNGYSVFGGAEYNVWRWLFAGAEAQYRAIPDAIGAAGVSEHFNETDLGGIAVRVLFGIRR